MKGEKSFFFVEGTPCPVKTFCQEGSRDAGLEKILSFLPDCFYFLGYSFSYVLDIFYLLPQNFCYKLCNMRYKLCNTYYKVCNMRYKVCNKNFLRREEKIAC